MCGITGIIGPDNITKKQSTLQRMTDLLAHRGPNADGFWHGEGVALGHRRLSIIDLSTSANQPIFDGKNRYCMVFNGEIYNYQEIRAQLKEYPFETNSDSEVLLAAYIKWGKDCLQRLNGMFAFAIWDQQTRRLFCARDRLGIKPFYYYHNEQYFVFSSELRSLLSSNLVPRNIDRFGLTNFLQYQTVNGERTIVKDVFQLKAGSYAYVEANKLSIYAYWRMDAVAEMEGKKKREIQSEVREQMLKAVERRMVSDVPLGAFLSGGIDSSAIVACMATISDQPVNTFSVGFNEKKYDESRYADIIAKKYNTKHTNIKLEPKDLLKELPGILEQMDRPSGDGPNTYIVSKATKEAGITVALSGLGGDELFAGYTATFLNFLRFRKHHRLWRIPHRLRKTFAFTMKMMSQRSKVNKAARVLSLPNAEFENVYPIFRRAFDDQEIAFLSNQLPSVSIVDQLFTSEQLSEIKGRPLLSQVSIGEIEFYTRDLLLRDTDQMSMAHALEVRVPFFDHKLVEYALSIPDSIKKPSYPKELLVESLKPMLPDEIVHRPKMGFTLPWEFWLKNELRTFCEHNIQHLAEREFFDQSKLSAYWKRFLQGDKSILWSRIWQLVVLGHWLDKNDLR